MLVRMTVNDEPVSRDVEPRLLLVHFLRDELGLTGTHWGCDTSNCGACAVWLDGEPVKSCTVLAVMADGHEVRTVEGLGRHGDLMAPAADGGAELDTLQRAFQVCHAVQCGFCTPGLLVAADEMLERNPNPTDADIREALSGNLCRCTGYEKIMDAVRLAAARQGEAV